MFRSSVIILILLLSFACVKRKEGKEDLPVVQSTEFAKGFTVKKLGVSTEVTLLEPYPNSTKSIKYLLVPKTEKIPTHAADVTVIRTPIESIVCTSTSHIALLDHLNALDLLVGFPSTDLISSSKARQRIDSGYVTDLGIDNTMNIESLVGLQPDLVMGYSIAGDMSKLDKIKSFGIPVVINAEYLENHPLGRAEWIKYMALFLGKEREADSIFTAIKNEYLNYQRIVENVKTKPTVISGILYGDTWFLPGGQNYGAKIFKDAGYHYLWDDDTSNGFLKLSFETVLSRGKEADYWIGVGNFKSRAEMKSSEGRYSLFQAFQISSIYTYDARVGVTGGSEYLELGYSRPDIILKDLIKIAHPELLPGYELYFHKKLN
ncbi:MAG TPA: ABC transporter substrate-binding protein [Cyclobacteriaceae bacterium]|nr:ABC transporter substrate-binding protein [Cyclobacteriaceae bacterium]